MFHYFFIAVARKIGSIHPQFIDMGTEALMGRERICLKSHSYEAPECS